ncbi:XRE family transcriptional regulator [Kibdelosporangium aridum]|uniref:XRE family transcriptional regulator n=1 Tax=Kibdelosporangium aridum TaxID=2030 RepID=A0A428Z1A7_KIBAR|nr:helix-turn-helix transcriptional regulator [Kibdelosporangium aridum]RSM78551.1 XRE family transcriptional regulator [Kibdelosporangium aridum]
MNTELREFLRSRRARVTPEEVGLPNLPGTRRVPGLRREEVAHLAGVSVDYYVRLERGKNVNVSESVLDALARALLLNETERTYLYTVAKPARRTRPMPPQRIRPGLRLALESMSDIPVMLLGRRMDVLATNLLARALYKDFDAAPPHERNIARYMFLDPAAREVYVDWADGARNAVAGLQFYAGQHPHDPELAKLVGELSVRDADFRRWWADHDVFRHGHGTKRLHHPVVGELTLYYESLIPRDDPDMMIAMHTAEPGSPSEQGLRLLASWAASAKGSDVDAEQSVDGVSEVRGS